MRSQCGRKTPRAFILNFIFTQENDEETKEALGMYSGEGEYVEFRDPVWCTGPVETWLNKIMNESQKTINSNVADGVVTYEEKARDLWLFDHAAQVALAGNQIWWTTEVGQEVDVEMCSLDLG